MEFITQEVATTLGLTEAQINGLTPLVSNHIADLQKSWDGKANENAERIIDGAIKPIETVTKIARNQGEKAADYIARASSSHLSGLQTELETAKAEYAQKLKDFKGDDATKAELQKAKDDLDNAKKQLADFDKYKEKAEKFEPLQNEYSQMKLQIAFSSVKPNFPQTVNPYEAKAKWDDFVKEVQTKYSIELVDGEAVCKDKENEYKTVKLKDLVTQSKELTELAQGRQQGGTGANPKGKQAIEGVPFGVPENATSQERSKAIQDYLATQGIGKMHKDYATKFAEFNKIILTKTAK